MGAKLAEFVPLKGWGLNAEFVPLNAEFVPFNLDLR